MTIASGASEAWATSAIVSTQLARVEPLDGRLGERVAERRHGVLAWHRGYDPPAVGAQRWHQAGKDGRALARAGGADDGENAVLGDHRPRRVDGACASEEPVRVGLVEGA